MKRIYLAISILALLAGVAAAQDYGCIGMFSDTDFVDCEADMEQYIYTTIYVAALLPPDIDDLTAAEFRIDNLPDLADALVTWEWTTNLVIGDPGWDISLAWTTPQPGPWVLFGQGNFFYVTPVPSDNILTILPGYDCSCLVIVDGDFVEYDAIGLEFTINCTNPDNCFCGWCFGTPVEEASWGSIKALY